MKTLYISDLDGTLFTNKAGLKDRAAEMLKRLSAKGVLFTYATARRFPSANFRMCKADIRLPVILMNGVIIADGRTGQPIRLNGFDGADLSGVREAAERYGETPLVYSFIGGEQRVSYAEWDTSRVKNYIKDRKGDKALRPCKSYEELFEGEIHYFTFINPILPQETVKDIFSEEKGFAAVSYFDCYHKKELWLEVFSAGATKAKAVLQLKDMLDADEVVCFGDNNNDISMFAVADRAYAVFNAVEELKERADGILGSNENISVPRFIEAEQTAVFAYTTHESAVNEPDAERFGLALEKAKAREKTNIGTLNEKCIHSALKNYFSRDYDQEAKIGSFYADIVTENGIYEIQTANFLKLNKKLEVMLSVCHVTVVYPFERRTRVITASASSGEVIRESGFRRNNSLTDFFLELYRIKSFLTDPNLTVCVAELDVERVNYVSENTGRRRGRGAYTKTPLALTREIYLEKPSDYMSLLPPLDGLPKEFTVKELQSFVKSTDAKLLLEIFLYLGAVDKSGKRGNAELYRFTV